MVNTELMFDLGRLAKGPYLSAIAVASNPSKVNITLGTPCIMGKASWESKSSEVRLLFAFPKDKGHPINEIYKSNKRNVVVTDDEPFINTHKIKMVSRFDWSKVESIQKYVENNGSLTLHISNYSADCGGEIMGIVMQEFFGEMTENLFNKYKHNSVELFSCDDSYRAATPVDLAHYITFLSLPNCIPIFNRKKVHGMGMIYRAVKSQHSLHTGAMGFAAQLAIILTNYPDNKYVVDGIAVGYFDPVHKDTIKRVKKLALINSKIKTKKGKQKKKKEEIPRGWIEISSSKRYDTTQATVNFGSSTTTYYSNSS